MGGKTGLQVLYNPSPNSTPDSDPARTQRQGIFRKLVHFVLKIGLMKR